MANSKVAKNPASGVVWDLDKLYKGVGDPKINADKKRLEKLTSAFTKSFKGKINSKKLTPELMLKAIRGAEEISQLLYVYLYYASLVHSKDLKSPEIGRFYQEAEEFGNEVDANLLWFTLEIQGLTEETAGRILSSKILRNYRHYLTKVRTFSKYKRSLGEEQIMTKLTSVSSSAFERLYDEYSASTRFVLDDKKYTYSEIAEIAKNAPTVSRRKRACISITKTYKRNSRTFAFILNTRLLNKKIIDDIRGFEYAQQSTYLDYEVNPRIIDALTSTVTKNYSLCEKYYENKSTLLKRKLYEWDRYNKIYPSHNTRYTWGDARDIILKSFYKFDSDFGDIATKFFDNGWIDAQLSPIKKSGAFCSYLTPNKNPYIFLNFTGSSSDITTLAHELGHGIHAYLSAQNSLYNYWPSTAVAEIASVFCESLVFDHLYENTKNRKEKINLLGQKIEGSFATIFRQTGFHLFETQINKHRRETGELSTDDFCKYYQSTTQQMFGRGLILTDAHKYWWMPISHFYHYNFYVFTYAFGEALALSLYQTYKESGSKFIGNYKAALQSGGSLSPKQITTKMGVDISQMGFWQESIDLLANYVHEFENLSLKYSMV